MQPQDDHQAEDMKEVGQNIKRRRESLGLSQDKLADRMNTDRNIIYRHENGIHNMSVCTFFSYADALNATPQELSPSRYKTGTVPHKMDWLLCHLPQLTEANLKFVEQTVSHLLQMQSIMQQK